MSVTYAIRLALLLYLVGFVLLSPTLAADPAPVQIQVFQATEPIHFGQDPPVPQSMTTTSGVIGLPFLALTWRGSDLLAMDNQSTTRTSRVVAQIRLLQRTDFFRGVPCECERNFSLLAITADSSTTYFISDNDARGGSADGTVKFAWDLLELPSDATDSAIIQRGIALLCRLAEKAAKEAPGKNR